MIKKIRAIAKQILIFFGLHSSLLWIRKKIAQIKYCKLQRGKERLIIDSGQKYGLNTLIETGTYYGDMIEAVRNGFQNIYSIELGNELYNKANERFKGYKNIRIIHGDSGEVLARLLAQINEPVVFWLDAHYSTADTVKGSTNTPIEQELRAIFNHRIKQHIILIDDAKDFTGHGDYPTAETVEKLATTNGYVFQNKEGTLRILPGSSN